FTRPRLPRRRRPTGPPVDGGAPFRDPTRRGRGAGRTRLVPQPWWTEGGRGGPGSAVAVARRGAALRSGSGDRVGRVRSLCRGPRDLAVHDDGFPAPANVLVTAGGHRPAGADPYPAAVGGSPRQSPAGRGGGRPGP